MGNLQSSSMLTGSINMEIAASADTVWATVTDKDATTAIVSNIESLELVTEGKQQAKGRYGDVYREVRKFEGKTYVTYKTITSVSVDPYSITVNIHHENPYRVSRDAARVGTWTIHPIDDKSCQFVLTYAAAPAGFSSCVWRALCRRCIERRTERLLLHDIQDYAAEAEKRQAALDGQQ